jgi:tyrosine-protein kinase Etk/Wzc
VKKANQSTINKDDHPSFQKLLFKYLPFWPVFLIFFSICATGLYFYLKFTIPIFETSASILIKDEKKGQEDSKMEEVLNVFGTKKIVENELEILKSNSIIKEVVIKMNLYAPIFEEKGWRGMGTTSAYMSSPIVVEVPNPDSLNQTKKIYFEITKDNLSILINGKQYTLNQWVETPWGIMRFSNNPMYRPITVKGANNSKFYFVLAFVDNVTKGVIDNIIATPTSKQSSVINLKIKDAIPQRAEKILTEIVIAYNNESIERKNDVAVKTLQFIENRLKHVSVELDSVEGGIQNYKNRSGIVDISEQSKLYLQSIEENDKQVNNLDMQLSALDEVEKYVASKNNSGNIVPSTFNITDATLGQLLTKLSSTESQYEKLRRTTAENNPILQSLQGEIANIKPSILENINNQRKSITAGKVNLEQTSNRYSAMLQTIPQKERELVEVSRQQIIKNNIYSFLLQKKEETSYSISSALPDCYIVSNPTSTPFPVSPKKTFLAFLTVIISLALGFVFISLKDIFNSKILFRSDIEKLTNYPILGEIIFENLKSKIVTENEERSFISEQFRLIRTALRTQGTPPGNIKRILVTSCIKGDGKSFVSTNLAMSLARSGKKVALFELDLHQPKLREIFDVRQSNGITDYLLGNASEEEIIFPTTKHANLFLLPAGNLVEEPSELLVNGKLENLFNYVDSRFDILVMDTAPLKVLTDGLVIAPFCNLVINVIRHNHTPKSHIEMLNQDMESYNIENVAIVFNGIKNRGFGKYSYGFGHGYGYDIRSSYEEYSKKAKKIS